jgi:Flp pilus assembly protein TadD
MFREGICKKDGYHGVMCPIQTGKRMARSERRSACAVLVVLALPAAILAVYGQATGFEFLIHDDHKYVTNNPNIRGGMSLESLRWALTAIRASNWHPLTWISHMIDWELYGADPAGHHATNILLHAVNAILIFVLFKVMTGRLWSSAVVSALFALHPLHVESVAWIAERKDLLSASFALLSALAYVAYARRGGGLRYLLTALLLALSLTAKPMAVTLPFVFLLLDFWPLERFRRGFTRLVLEKMPLLLLSALSCVITLVAQHRGGAVASIEAVTFPLRLANAVVSYVRYMVKTVWPTELSILYPHPYLLGGSPWRWWQVVGAFLVLAAASWLVLRATNRKYLAVGWLWFLGMLVPVLGLVQVGPQAMADRYTYLPLTGLFLMLVWSVAGALPRRPAALLALSVLFACAACSWGQAKHWKDSVSLFERALEASPGHPVIRNYLGTALDRAGRSTEAFEQFRLAVVAAPGYAKANFNLGSAFLKQRNFEMAVRHLRLAVMREPRQPDFLTNLGNALQGTGLLEEALASYRLALEADPAHAEANYNLGLMHHRRGELAEAMRHYHVTLRTKPDHAPAHNNLGLALQASGMLEEAIEHYRQALRIDPAHTKARNNLEAAQRQR